MILLELSESIFSFVLTDALLMDQFSNHVEKLHGYFKAADGHLAFSPSRRFSMFTFWISREPSCLMSSHPLGKFLSNQITYSASN